MEAPHGDSNRPRSEAVTAGVYNTTTCEDDQTGAAGGATVTWSRCKELLLDFHLNSDRIFYRIGLSIATKPWLWLIISLCLNVICGCGLLFWKEEIDEVELYMPIGSVFRKDAAWVKEHFQDDLRHEIIIVTAPNVLDPEVLRSIKDIEEDVKNIVVHNNTWKDVCAGHFTWFQKDGKPLWETMDKSELPANYLQMINDTMSKDACIYKSLLKLWPKDVDKLTKEEILKKVNDAMRYKRVGMNFA